MNFTMEIIITRRPTILDPEGKAVEHALHELGLGNIANVRIGKHVKLIVTADDEEQARAIVEEACRKLLANPVMDDYTITRATGS
ncbi:MAG: phosphoribosylformylglycinamidine synthase subunit PurS [Bacteroidota bacterium]|nr:phosphoribosylformylglycinamidine synthase subunit PurS [Bacteroidota bacterium]